VPRRCCRRRVGWIPGWSVFRPSEGEPGKLDANRQVVLTLDELEAIRLADLEGLYHEQAAERMGISRATFGRILEAARRKVADALVGGKVIRVEGGDVEVIAMRKFLCSQCGHTWEVPYGIARPAACPQCGSAAIHRHPSDRGGPGMRGGWGRCRRRGWARGGRGPVAGILPQEAPSEEAPEKQSGTSEG